MKFDTHYDSMLQSSKYSNANLNSKYPFCIRIQ
jgi:hypothetical protein